MIGCPESPGAIKGQRQSLRETGRCHVLALKTQDGPSAQAGGASGNWTRPGKSLPRRNQPATLAPAGRPTLDSGHRWHGARCVLETPG